MAVALPPGEVSQLNSSKRSAISERRPIPRGQGCLFLPRVSAFNDRSRVRYLTRRDVRNIGRPWHRPGINRGPIALAVVNQQHQ